MASPCCELFEQHYTYSTKDVGYEKGDNGAQIHQIRILPSCEACEGRLRGQDPCCNAVAALQRMQQESFWAKGVVATKSRKSETGEKKTKEFTTVAVSQCSKFQTATLAAVVRLDAVTQPGDIQNWLKLKLQLCHECCVNRVDIFRLNEQKNAAASATVTTPELIRQQQQQARHRLWDKNLNHLLQQPGVLGEPALLYDFKAGGSPKLISAPLTAALQLPATLSEKEKRQRTQQHVHAILKAHSPNVLSCEINSGLHPTMTSLDGHQLQRGLPPLNAENILAWHEAGMSSAQFEECLRLGRRYQAAWKLLQVVLQQLRNMLKRPFIGPVSTSELREDLLQGRSGMTVRSFKAETDQRSADQALEYDSMDETSFLPMYIFAQSLQDMCEAEPEECAHENFEGMGMSEEEVDALFGFNDPAFMAHLKDMTETNYDELELIVLLMTAVTSEDADVTMDCELDAEEPNPWANLPDLEPTPYAGALEQQEQPAAEAALEPVPYTDVLEQERVTKRSRAQIS